MMKIIWAYVRLAMVGVMYLIGFRVAVGAYPNKETAVAGLWILMFLTTGLLLRYLETNELPYKWIVSLGSMFVVAWIIRWFFPI
ncbi:hypothetical protein [Alloscardovia macacae]|uniref:Uncharacterized protein n=1 Tax=Alloscardovia macacae TaxID=1160091 RepID=A0A261F3F6_9BIFI|nr:hypothetical protein [Alloscardovia macacae]OZG53605.1 hypothetical protein ALMA_1170 [Alloscardovia macacae]